MKPPWTMTTPWNRQSRADVFDVVPPASQREARRTCLAELAADPMWRRQRDAGAFIERRLKDGASRRRVSLLNKKQIIATAERAQYLAKIIAGRFHEGRLTRSRKGVPFVDQQSIALTRQLHADLAS